MNEIFDKRAEVKDKERRGEVPEEDGSTADRNTNDGGSSLDDARYGTGRPLIIDN